MNKFPRWVLIFNSISTTNLKIYLTCVLAMGTGITYWVTAREPAEGWLLFLAGFAGIDVAQYATKRITHRELVSGPSTTIDKNASQESDENDSGASTDVKELSKQILKG